MRRRMADWSPQRHFAIKGRISSLTAYPTSKDVFYLGELFDGTSSLATKPPEKSSLKPSPVKFVESTSTFGALT
jgi:hypothetical protein